MLAPKALLLPALRWKLEVKMIPAKKMGMQQAMQSSVPMRTPEPGRLFHGMT